MVAPAMPAMRRIAMTMPATAPPEMPLLPDELEPVGEAVTVVCPVVTKTVLEAVCEAVVILGRIVEAGSPSIVPTPVK
jgi:hypothetical protein